MPYCPNCDTEVSADAATCPRCGADFEGPDAWRPEARPGSQRRGRRTFWGGPGSFSYEHDEYAKLVDEISRRPLEPAAGLPLFGALFAAAILAKSHLGPVVSALLLFVPLFLFPYYVVQLLMRWRMQQHQKLASRTGEKPSYVPSNSRSWAGVYIATFIATAYVLMGLDGLVSR